MSPQSARARAIALYLPQFHPIPENDEWWGKGFTEWTNVTRAKPLFPKHYQPHLPADLGFYDLRLPEDRLAQANLARQYGIEGFCYYHYWFAGKRLLERPFLEVLRSGEPDYPFCLCWANESWAGKWHGAQGQILMEQTYPGAEDDEAHFYTLLEAFRDKRYIKVDGRPLLLIYKQFDLPDAQRTIRLWRDLARESGLKGLYLLGMQTGTWAPADLGFDGATVGNLTRAHDYENRVARRLRRYYRTIRGYPTRIYDYSKTVRRLSLPQAEVLNMHPTVIPNWDNTPRCGVTGSVLRDSTPELFGEHVRSCLAQIQDKPLEHRLIFIKSWNEWAEGNHLEPDMRFGTGYLDAFAREIIL